MVAAQTASSRLRLAGLALAALAAVLLALSLAVPSWSRVPSKVVGITAAIVNDVRIKPAALAEFARARLRQRVALADQLRTGPDSHLQIALLDDTKISVGANAQLTIDKFVYDPDGGSLSVTAAKGALRFMSGTAKSNRSLRTPAATIGIRGTVFDTAVGALAVEIAQREPAIPRGTQHDPATATLAVLRGPGPNRQGKASPGAIDVTAAGETVALEKPLLAAYVPYAGAPPIGPFTISLPGLNLLNNFILPPPPRREFSPATQAYPAPQNGLREPPPWADPRWRPPSDGAGSAPEPGFDVPGLPTLPEGDLVPPEIQRPAGDTVAPTPMPTRSPQSQPTTAPQSQPLGTPIG